MSTHLLTIIGHGIESTANAILRQVYGLRIPAARVRLQDRLDDRHFILHSIEQAKADHAYWSAELGRCESAIESATDDLWNLAIKANSRSGFCACDALSGIHQGHSTPVRREMGGNS